MREEIEIIERNVPIKCGGAWVNPGDVIFGDEDGVVVIPQELAADTVRLAEEKFEREKAFQKGLEGGASVAEMYREYKVL